MKKVILIAAVLAAVFSSTAFAGHHGNMTRANCAYSICQHNYCGGKGSNYIYSDGDGICDNCGAKSTAYWGRGCHNGGRHCR